MQDLVYICAQPSIFYYAWQVDTMILSFQKQGVNLNNVHIVSAGINPDPYFVEVQNKWTSHGVAFAYYEDTREDAKYISSIRPHILEKHWLAYPELANRHIFYHDCDIALTKPIPELDAKLQSNKTYLSNTIDYIGAKYVDSKEHGILQIMCDIVNIDIELVRSKEAESGGAQYLIPRGINAKFWHDVYANSEELYLTIVNKNHTLIAENPGYHEIQIWCADMWAVLWNLWKMDFKTEVHKDLDFTWGTSTMPIWHQNAIYHNAGVVSEEPGKPFCKAVYLSKDPTIAPRPTDRWASQNYYDLVVEAWNQTHGKEKPVTKKVNPQSITKKT